MKTKEIIAIRILLFAVRLMLGYSADSEYKEMINKVDEDLKKSEGEK